MRAPLPACLPGLGWLESPACAERGSWLSSQLDPGIPALESFVVCIAFSSFSLLGGFPSFGNSPHIIVVSFAGL